MANPNFLSYNGIGMDLIKLKGWKREKIYNGNQYLYTRHTISVVAVLNPAVNPVGGGVLTTATQAIGNATGIYNAAFDKIPAFLPQATVGMVTDANIRHALMQPRCQLNYNLLGYPSLYSPWLGYTCDASGGPFPLEFNVLEVQSAKTWIVEYTIQTDVNECQKWLNKPKFLISHTWTMSHSVDADCYTTRVIEGRAVFDRAVLEAATSPSAIKQIVTAANQVAAAAGNKNPFPQAAIAAAGVLSTPGGFYLSPDAARDELFHELPTNFKREKVEVKLQPDGCTLDYVITDRERALSFNLLNVTRVEGIHTVKTAWAGAKGMWEATKQLGEHIRNSVIGALEAPGAGGWVNVGVASGAALAVGLVSSAVAFGIAMVESEIPQVVHIIQFRLYGNRLSDRASLTKAAFSLLASRLATLQGIIPDGKVLNAGLKAGLAAGQVGLQNLGVGGAVLQGQAGLAGVGVNLDALSNISNIGINDLFNPGGIIPIAVGVAALSAGFECEITHDLAGKTVDLKFATLASPFSIFLAGPSAASFLTRNDDTTLFGDKIGEGISSTVWDGIQGIPFESSKARGTYLEQLVSQILLTPCQTPPAQTTQKITLVAKQMSGLQPSVLVPVPAPAPALLPAPTHDPTKIYLPPAQPPSNESTYA